MVNEPEVAYRPATHVQKVYHQIAQQYDESYFAKMEKELGNLKGTPIPCCYTEEEIDDVILESEKSGVVDSEEINAFFARWKSLS